MSVFQCLYFSVCISVSVFQCLYFSVCISVSVFQCLYFSVCISVSVFQCLYFSVCISVSVFQCLYFSVCISVSVFQCPEAGNQCPVYVLDLYINKLPPEAITQDIFFFRPLERTPVDSTAPWYIASQPVGKNTLE